MLSWEGTSECSEGGDHDGSERKLLLGDEFAKASAALSAAILEQSTIIRDIGQENDSLISQLRSEQHAAVVTLQREIAVGGSSGRDVIDTRKAHAEELQRTSTECSVRIETAVKRRKALESLRELMEGPNPNYFDKFDVQFGSALLDAGVA